MTKRSTWTDFTKEERKYIKKRDHDECIYCGFKGALQIAHIFLNRSHGGAGVRYNAVLLCTTCHQKLDNPIGNQKIESQKIQTYSENYLEKKENLKELFKDRKSLIDYLKYDKNRPLEEQKQVIHEDLDKKGIINQETKKRCKHCIYLIKKRQVNSTLFTYYCRYKKMRISKWTEACTDFKKEGIKW